MDKKLQNITLELSSKPFCNDSEELMYSVSRKMFHQWKRLTDSSDMVSVMLLISDGSEIFEYSGDLEQTFEWAYWIGCANHCPRPEKITPRIQRDTHKFPAKYREDITPRSYSWLKRLIEVLRETGKEITGKPIRIGAFYDNGPEFAISDFKFKRHKEIAQAHTLYPNSFVTCISKLHEDSHSYAGFPDGIPEGTSLGTFLGKQYREYSSDLGFDYLWLSNGMGFGIETWGITGQLFDKQKFYPERAEEARKKILTFWQDFYDACPGCVLETRGSNFSAGMEIGSDACPLKELYSDFKIAPPVNSPWAALNYNTGLEAAAWMSHVAELPDDRFPFRYYIHDPWFLNSPWLDRYEQEPWDIYMPLSICRIRKDGSVQTPNRLAFLSMDDSYGRMPDQVPSEVIPHLQEAFRKAPDQPGPLVWVYPFEEYNELIRGTDPRPDIPFSEDLFLGECLQQGLPLNTVISTGNFRNLMEQKNNALDSAVLIIPLSAYRGNNIAPIRNFLKNNGSVIFYGALNGAIPEAAELLNLSAAEPVSGKAEIKSFMTEDVCREGSVTKTVYLFPQYSCGGLTEIPLSREELRAAVLQNGTERAAVLKRDLPDGGTVGFVRLIPPASKDLLPEFRHFHAGEPGEIYPSPALMRQILKEFGWDFQYLTWEEHSLTPRTAVSRNNNAFYFNIFAPDTTVEMNVKTPFGAPLLTSMETRLNGEGYAVWHPGKSWHKECRCFVRQKKPAVISAKRLFQEYPAYFEEGKISYGPFDHAELRFFPPADVNGKLEVIAIEYQGGGPGLLTRDPLPLEWEESSAGKCAVLRDVSGYIVFACVKD